MKDIFTSLRLVVLSMLVCCVLYPAIVLAFGQLVTPWTADGSMIRNAEGRVVGSELIAQAFTQPRYFRGRPSAVDYDASATGGSNLSPTNPKLTERAEQIIHQYGLIPGQKIPAELVTASGSGMDPNISVTAAKFQAERVANARHVPVEKILSLIDSRAGSSGPDGLGGQRLINVLELNMTLDKQMPVTGQ